MSISAQIDLGGVKSLVAELRSQIPELKLAADRESQLLADLASIKRNYLLRSQDAASSLSALALLEIFLKGAQAAIPTPDRGYWAKREAGKYTCQPPLSERPPGLDDEVVVTGGKQLLVSGMD